MIQLRYPKSVQYKQKEIKSKKVLKKALSKKWANVIHISAHGDSEKYPSGRRGKQTSIEIGEDDVTSDYISTLKSLNADLVFVSACFNSYQDMAKAFLGLNVNHYLAPKTNVDWIQAALFSTMFYKRYLWDKTSFKAAYNYACVHTKSGKDFPEFWYL